MLVKYTKCVYSFSSNYLILPYLIHACTGKTAENLLMLFIHNINIIMITTSYLWNAHICGMLVTPSVYIYKCLYDLVCRYWPLPACPCMSSGAPVTYSLYIYVYTHLITIVKLSRLSDTALRRPFSEMLWETLSLLLGCSEHARSRHVESSHAHQCESLDNLTEEEVGLFNIACSLVG